MPGAVHHRRSVRCYAQQETYDLQWGVVDSSQMDRQVFARVESVAFRDYHEGGARALRAIQTRPRSIEPDCSSD